MRPSNSEWTALVCLVPKSDGTLRFCVDYRRLNSVSKRDSYPLPRLDDCLDSLGNAQYFTTLDCNSGYWQIPIAKEDQQKTAFTTHTGTFEWNRMPFGLCNAPATFQRTLDIMLSGFRWKTCLVYVDDVVIFSSSFDEHLDHVRQILTVLKKGGLSLKLKKCVWFSPTVDYLGHVIYPGKLAVAKKNTIAIEKFTWPKTQTEVRAFLGICNMYRRFAPNFARVAAPLNSLLTKGQPKSIPPPTEEQLRAFDTLRKALIAPPILILPDSSKPFSIDTDACDHQIGAALFQEGDDGVRHPVGFWSRSLNSAERNYSASERECLAVWAVQILRPYLEGKHFMVHTDHAALRWVLHLTESSGRLARWRLRLLEFDFTIKYKKGAANSIADAISRLPSFAYTGIEPDDDIPTHPCLLVENRFWGEAMLMSILDRHKIGILVLTSRWG